MIKPLVSVIMNCYNSEAYLSEAIESVLNQTYKNFELIFWDNKSTDNSAKIFKSYDDKRLKYFCANEFTSLYKARNLAISMSKGDLISFLDCDDIWVKNKLSYQLKLFNKGYKIIYGPYQVIDKDGKKLSEPNINLYSGYITNRLLSKNLISIGSIMIVSDIFKKEKFDDNLNLIGDFELWFRLSKKYKFIFTDEIIEFSREHPENTSKILNDKWIIEYKYFIKKHFSFKNILNYPYFLKYIFRYFFKYLTRGFN